MEKHIAGVTGKNAEDVEQQLWLFFQSIGLPLPSSREEILAIGARAAERAGFHSGGTDGFQLEAELAWYLLHARWYEPNDLIWGDSFEESTDEQSRILLTLMPRWRQWIEYLEKFPDHPDLGDYRAERLSFVRQVRPLVHPDVALLADHTLAPSGIEPKLRHAVIEHTRGPVVCFQCRDRALSLARTDAPNVAEPRVLAAADGDDDDAGLTVVWEDVGRNYLTNLRYQDDAGYLRIFLASEHDTRIPRSLYRVQFRFKGGDSIETTFRHPDETFQGVIVGSLEGRSLSEIDQVLWEKLEDYE